MYFSRLTLNAAHNRTKSERDRPYELHRTLCKAWEDPMSARILMRVEDEKPGIVTVIVQSLAEPDWSRLGAPRDYLRSVEGPKHIEMKALKPGQHLQFRLRCRPTKRIGARDNIDRGKRRGITTKHEIFDWLKRKAEANGFKVCEASFERVYWYDSKNGLKNCLLGGIQFDGVLEVTNPERLRDAILNGIGTQKAYGFGLLSIARAREIS